MTKNELLDTLWPGEAVSDSVLPRCIAAMRRAVGDSRTQQQVVATAHGRGYRFVAEVKTAGAPVQKTPAASTPAPAARGEPVRGRSKLVGRVGPMARLAETLDRTAAGRGGVALIVASCGRRGTCARAAAGYSTSHGVRLFLWRVGTAWARWSAGGARPRGGRPYARRHHGRTAQ